MAQMQCNSNRFHCHLIFDCPECPESPMLPVAMAFSKCKKTNKRNAKVFPVEYSKRYIGSWAVENLQYPCVRVDPI